MPSNSVHQHRPCAAALTSRTPTKTLECPAVLVCPGFLADHRGAECAELRRNLSLHLGSWDNSSCSGSSCDQQDPVVEVLPIARSDWYPTLRGGSFSFYVDALAAAVEELHGRHGTVALVCLSAAGWIARLALGGEPYAGRVYGLSGKVDSLVTLGTPHYSLEAYPFGRIPERREGEDPLLPDDVRGSSLRLANRLYPTADSLSPTRVVCVCGTARPGPAAPLAARVAQAARGEVPWGLVRDEWLAGVSYEATCCRRDVEGDGVTPLESALLPGARHVLLPGVWHSPGGGRRWYGSEAVVPLWAAYLAKDPVHQLRV